MIKKFQHKLLLAFGLLIIIIITLVLLTVNTTINSVSQVRIENDLHMAQRVFEEFALSKRKTRSDAAAAMIKTHPVLRAILGSNSSNTDDLFGEKNEASSDRIEDINFKIYSAVETLDLYKNSEIFAITDEKAELLFTKADPKLTKINLSELDIVKAALAGNEVVAHWGSEEEVYLKLGLMQKTKEAMLFDVFIKPIVFGEEVKGLMIVGFPITSTDLRELEQVTRARISFILNGNIYGNGEGIPENAIDVGIVKPAAVVEFKKNKTTYLSLVSELKDSVGDGKVVSVIYRSKSEELSFYTLLKKNLNIIGATALILALVVANFISGGVTRSIRDLMDGVNQIHKGNLDHKVTVKGVDEFFQLAQQFNLMTTGLKEKEHIKNTFKRYVSPHIVNLLLEDQNKLKLGGDKRRLIIYFADIAGFTTLSEKLSVEETIAFLNTYLSRVATLIENSEGIIDKYIGDAVMAYWIPTDDDDTCEKKVCEVALKHREVVESLKRDFKFSSENILFDARIGIHAGDAIIGNIGSTERMDFTIIGDNVNLASRLEALNKQYGSHILVSDEIATKVGSSYVLRKLDNVRVVGKSKLVVIHELLRSTAEGAPKEDEHEFCSAIDLYQKADFKSAKLIFERLGENDPVAQKFSKRCTELIENPPTHWDGSFQAQKK